MPEAPNTIDRVETAANIYVQLTVDGSSFEVPVSEVDLTKEVDMERVRETGLYPDGYAINAIDIDGSITFAGHVVRIPGSSDTKNLDNLLFNEDGTPVIFDISVVHENIAEDGSVTDGSSDTLENCIVNSSNYNASSGDSTESSYEFMAQRMNTSG
jgi:hypothetical protein